MLGLPPSTEFNKRIPKQKFYENLPVTPALKRVFVEQIRLIYWRNKLAVTTLNVAVGKEGEEVQVFELKLTGPTLDETALRQMDGAIPYHILFLLEYEGKVQAWIGYKEAGKVSRYYHTDWMEEAALPLRVEGLDMDAVYANFVRQVAGEELTAGEDTESLRESVQREEQRRKLQKQIDALAGKVRKEKQLNRQMKINAELKKLRSDLEKL